MELYRNDDHVIANMYTFLLRFIMEEEVQECRVKRAKNFGSTKAKRI